MSMFLRGGSGVMCSGVDWIGEYVVCEEVEGVRGVLKKE